MHIPFVNISFYILKSILYFYAYHFISYKVNTDLFSTDCASLLVSNITFLMRSTDLDGYHFLLI